MTTTSCPLGIDPADVVAWAIDGEPHPVDLAAHVPGCGACQAALAAVAPAASLGADLRRAPAEVPAQVGRRAFGRIRLEVGALMLLRTFFGAGARVASALPHLLHPERDDRSHPRRTP